MMWLREWWYRWRQQRRIAKYLRGKPGTRIIQG
jgi:hypothetical protein